MQSNMENTYGFVKPTMPDEKHEFDEMKRKVQTLEHQHAALLSTIERVIRRIEALEQAKAQ
jgi:hypothetical protein